MPTSGEALPTAFLLSTMRSLAWSCATALAGVAAGAAVVIAYERCVIRVGPVLPGPLLAGGKDSSVEADLLLRYSREEIKLPKNVKLVRH